MNEWIGFDFDGTLCRLSDSQPVPSMVERVRQLRAQGVEVRILTARIASKYGLNHIESHSKRIKEWCLEHIGEVLPVTSEKDYGMVLLYDDRAIAVETDTGNLRGWYDKVGVGVGA